MNGLTTVSLLLQYLSLAPHIDVTNYLLCHGPRRYLSYIPSHELLLPIGEISTPFNVNVFTSLNHTSGDIFIAENNPDGDAKALSIDHSMNLFMSTTSVAVFEIESILLDMQTFILLKTTYNNETYYLRSTSINVTLVDEEYKNEIEDRQEWESITWQELIFSIVGPIV